MIISIIFTHNLLLKILKVNNYHSLLEQIKLKKKKIEIN